MKIVKCLPLLAMILVTACATVPRPAAIPAPGKEIETVQSPVSVTVKTAKRSIGGRGFLVFRHPDQFHMAILSPFGFTVMEMYSDGERLTCIIPSKDVAYQGLLSDLPEQGGLKNWGLIKWVVERPPVAGPSLGAREIVMADGRREQIFFDSHGLVQRKVTEDGDEALYKGYRDVNGVAFPETIEMINRNGDRILIAFDEPEVNQPVEEAALKPKLDNVTVLPISEFRGL
ncbi:lipoprotein insertase outer membrane protein LolB [Geotalea sp. SG265]|uniref:lipoprotein insertase outer membrane protein LolB n=1 Tax=Geotalea sp. SG265 TaxID=2922867 RepID=UPI001FB002F0|nr:lipoprotein insertase outer membrane protein LolB [Geotalea sp. SG265]